MNRRSFLQRLTALDMGVTAATAIGPVEAISVEAAPEESSPESLAMLEQLRHLAEGTPYNFPNLPVATTVVAHVCRCYHCHPEMFPAERLKPFPEHVAVRWDDRDKLHGRDLSVYFEGEKLKTCVEAVAGDDGLAIVANEEEWHPNFDAVIHGCQNCGSGDLCLEVRHGRVEIRRER